MSRQRWAIAEASDRNADVLARHGLRSSLHAAAGGGQRPAHYRQRALERRDGRPVGRCRACSGMMLQSALLGMGAFLTHQGRDDGGRHHRLLDCRLARAGADRGGDRQLARFHGRAQGVPTARCGAGHRCREVADPLRLPAPTQVPQLERHLGGGARHADHDARQRQLRSNRGHGAGGDRAERGRQVDPGARYYGGVAPGPRGGAPRRGGAWRAGRPRSLASTSATCRRTCSCSTAPSPRTSPASRNSPTARR